MNAQAGFSYRYGSVPRIGGGPEIDGRKALGGHTTETLEVLDEIIDVPVADAGGRILNQNPFVDQKDTGLLYTAVVDKGKGALTGHFLENTAEVLGRKAGLLRQILQLHRLEKALLDLSDHQTEMGKLTRGKRRRLRFDRRIGSAEKGQQNPADIRVAELDIVRALKCVRHQSPKPQNQFPAVVPEAAEGRSFIEERLERRYHFKNVGV